MLSKDATKESPPGIVIFDLDDTLSQSKTPPDAEMVSLFTELLKITPIAVVGGGKFEQFKLQLVDSLHAEDSLLKNLYLFPTSGTSFYCFKDGDWTLVYEERLSDDEKARIREALDEAITQSGFDMSVRSYGKRLEDRVTQMSFSALGQEAPIEEKMKWDPDKKKRAHLLSFLTPLLPDFEVRSGGSTTIDITRKGIDKSYAIKKVTEHVGMTPDEMIFIGDRLAPGGNDYEVLSRAGVVSFAVRGPESAKEWIRTYLKETGVKQ